MNQDKFLAEYFSKDDTVTVNANELQAILRDLATERRERTVLTNRINELQYKYNTLQSKYNVLLLDKPLHVDLTV